MYNLDKAYSKKFFTRRKSLAWRIPIVCDAIIDVLKPKSVIDIGCGNGDLVKGFINRNIQTFGIEGTVNALSDVENFDRIWIYDLRKDKIEHPFTFRKFDLAICFEVAEHIEPEYTNIFLDNLYSLSDRILFSAAGPGQGGIHHHNCQPKEYWEQKFKDKNYIRPDILIDEYVDNTLQQIRPVETLLQFKWQKWRNKKGIKAYYQNLMYFERLEKWK
ncbi:MAG: class I SAM-dependent methyltransferase [Candidatus Thorarchaeota archaeon]